jgi:hypothetical protein
MNTDDEEARAYARRLLLLGIAYEDMPASGSNVHLDRDTHITSLTFMSGFHFERGATHWKDASKAAIGVAAPILNGFKHLEAGGKRLHKRAAAMNGPLRLANVTLRWHTDLFCEVIPSAPDPKTKKRYCAGYRLHIIGHEQGGSAADDDNGNDDGDGGGEAGEPAARRGRANPALKALNEEARRRPLACALSKSFAEAAEMREIVQRARESYVRQNAKSGHAKAMMDANLRIRDAHAVEEYLFAEHDSMESYLYGAVQPYFRVPTSVGGAHPTHDPWNGFLDFYPGCSELRNAHDDIAATTRHKTLDLVDYFVHEESPIQPDKMFCLERSLAYFMRGGTYTAARECTQLDHYIPGAVGRGQPRQPPPQAQARRPKKGQKKKRPRIVSDHEDEDDGEDEDEEREEEGEEGEEEEEEDEDDSENAESSSADAEGEDDEAQEDVPEDDPMDVDLRRYLYESTGKAVYQAVARPTWAFPRLVTKINSLVSWPEIFSTVAPLPFPIGAEIPEAAFKPLTPDEARTGIVKSVISNAKPLILTQSLRACERLRRAEEGGAAAALPPADENSAAGASSLGRDDDNAPIPLEPRKRTLPEGMYGRATVRARDGTIYHQTVRNVEIMNIPDPTQNAGEVLDRYKTITGQNILDPLRESEELQQEGIERVPDRFLPVIQHHVQVVRLALSALARRFRQMKYEELYALTWDHHQEPSASDGFMPPRDFYPPRHTHNDSELTNLQRIRKTFEACKGEANFTASEERDVLASVEMFPEWLLEREEPLEQRQKFQMARAMMALRQTKQLEELARADAEAGLPMETRRLKRLLKEEQHAIEREEWACEAWQKFDEVYTTTQRMSPALLAIRDYTKNHVLPNAQRPSNRRNIIANVRPFAAVRQFYMDTYRSSELATKTNCPYTERVHTCAHHALRWKARRDEPALNYTMYGESGAGKSKALGTTHSLLPPGVVSDTTNATTNAQNVDQNADGEVILYQEMDSALLFSGSKKDDPGTAAKTNFAKARMTSFFTQIKYFHLNEETGKREARTSNSSQHVVTLGATNQELTKMDKNMRRRLLIDIFAESPNNSEGGNPGDQVRHQNEIGFEYRVTERASAEHRELYCGYGYMEAAIKMGVIEDVLMNNGAAFLDRCLKCASPVIGTAGNSKGNKAWVLEAARILTIQHATYRTLFSPMADLVYKTDPKIKRWSPQAFQYLGEPHLALSKDSVIHALTMLDFLYSSVTEDRLLATIALNLLHVDDPSRWNFRRLPEQREDYNYLMFTGASYMALNDTIRHSHEHVAKLRSEDIPMLLKKHIDKRETSLGFDVPERGADGKYVRMVRRVPGPENIREDRRVIIYEDDPRSTAQKRKPQQFCMSIEFIENLFGVDLAQMSSAKVRERIAHTPRCIPADVLRDKTNPAAALAFLNELLTCSDSRAPLVAGIRQALRMPHLECHPYEHAELAPPPKEIFRYGTFYLPEDVYVEFPETSERIRVPVDGTSMFIQGVRDTAAQHLMVENFAKPLATGRSSLYDRHPGEDQVEDARKLSEMSRGFMYDRYDCDYYSYDAVMRRSGHPGIPILHEFYIKALVHNRDRDRYKDEEAFKQQLFDAVPYLDPAAGVPLPFGFGPIAYTIDRYLALEVHKWPQAPHYPLTNALERLDDTVQRHHAKLTNNSNGAFDYMSARQGLDDRDLLVAYKRKRAVEEREVLMRAPTAAAGEGEGEEEEEERRPTKRARRASPARDDSFQQQEEEEVGEAIDAMDIDEPAATSLVRKYARAPLVTEEDEEDLFTE